MSTDMIESQGLRLQLEMLIFGKANEVTINLKSGALNVTKDGKVSDLQIVAPVGGKTLSRDYDKETNLFERTVNRSLPPRASGRTSVRQIGVSSGWDAVARNMSNVLPITESEIKALVAPFLAQGFQKLWVYTKANGYGLANVLDCEEKYDFKNEWCVSGSPPNDEWQFVNSLLKARKSNLRIRTSRTFAVRVLGEDT